MPLNNINPSVSEVEMMRLVEEKRSLERRVDLYEKERSNTELVF